jgi:cold shock CspA family protein
MGKSQETWNKKETEKKRLKKKQEKEEKKLEKKSNPKSGSSLDDMIAYVDEFGNITSTPPDPNKKKTVIREEDIVLGVPKHEAIIEEAVRKGIVTNFNDSKGYGFIKDLKSQESIFVHANGLINQIKEGDKVTFEIQMGPKGPNAVEVKITVA